MKALVTTAVKTNSTVSDTRDRTRLCSRNSCVVSLALTVLSITAPVLSASPVSALEVKTPQLAAQRASQRAAFLRQTSTAVLTKTAEITSTTVLTHSIQADSNAPALTTTVQTPVKSADSSPKMLQAPDFVNGLVVEQALLNRANKEAIVRSAHEPATTCDASNSPFHDPSIAHEPLLDKGSLAKAIPNFALVNQHIWRGGAPGKAGVAKLAQNGVKTIIDLRMTGVGTMAEEADAKALGLNYVHIPMTFNCPPVNTVAHFMHVATNPLNQPVYVHCRQGADRTGLLIGIMRITQDHWSYRQAYSEMRQHHFKPWFSNLSKMVANYENNRQSQRQLAQATQAFQ